MAEDKKELEIAKLKKNYEILQKKHSLPDFKFLNENFEIENIESESELIIKAIRKQMTEKIFYVLRSLEMFLNGQNAPMFIFDVLKLFSESDKERVKSLYDKVSKYEIEAFGLEAEYSEKSEIEFIKKFSADWKDISEDLKRIYSTMKDNHNKGAQKNTKTYFG